MRRTCARSVLGNALSASSREQLTGWLVANKTGDTRLRAGLPAGWRVGDKTGTGGDGTTNDVGILWPPGRAPIIVTAYLTETTAVPPTQREAAIAAVGHAVAEAARNITLPFFNPAHDRQAKRPRLPIPPPAVCKCC